MIALAGKMLLSICYCISRLSIQYCQSHWTPDGTHPQLSKQHPLCDTTAVNSGLWIKLIFNEAARSNFLSWRGGDVYSVRLMNGLQWLWWWGNREAENGNKSTGEHLCLNIFLRAGLGQFGLTDWEVNKLELGRWRDVCKHANQTAKHRSYAVRRELVSVCERERKRGSVCVRGRENYLKVVLYMVSTLEWL